MVDALWRLNVALMDEAVELTGHDFDVRGDISVLIDVTS